MKPGKKEQDTFSDFLLGCAANRRWVFSYFAEYEAKKKEAHINSVDERKQYLRMKAGHVTLVVSFNKKTRTY